jgi:hypothetical protein
MPLGQNWKLSFSQPAKRIAAQTQFRSPMSESSNPYAASELSTEAVLGDPIYFSGTLTREDLQVSLLNSPQLAGAARIRPTIIAAIFYALLLSPWLLIGGPPPALLLALLCIKPWTRLLHFVMPFHRKRVKRCEIMSKNQREMLGSIDEDHLIISSDNSNVRAAWSHFAPALFFPTHLLLPFASEIHRRICIPWRFFDSPDEIQDVCQFIKERIGTTVDLRPKGAQLAEISREQVEVKRLDHRRAKAWSSMDWPLGDTAAMETRFEIDVSKALTPVRILASYLLSIGLVIFLYPLPCWIVIGYWWFQQDGGQFGETGDHIPLLSGIAFFFVLTLSWMFKRLSKQLRAQKKSLSIGLRSVGIHVSRSNMDAWLNWSSISELIFDDKSAGWIIKESLEESRIPAACFADRSRFTEFRSALAAHGPPKDHPLP